MSDSQQSVEPPHWGVAPVGTRQPPLLVGGQALLEGVLMRTPQRAIAVVRRKDGTLVEREIVVRRRASSRAGRVVQAPLMLLDALRVGSTALQFSARIYEEDEQTPAPHLTLMLWTLWLSAALSDEPAPSPHPQPPANVAPLLEVPRMNLRRVGAALVSGGFAATALFALPQAVAWLLSYLLRLATGIELSSVGPGFQVLTAVVLLLAVALYVRLIGRIGEVRRLFMYHGAEHKSVHAYEAGLPLRVENAGRQTRLHPRCGTSLIVGVALLSIPWFAVLAFNVGWLGLSGLAAHGVLLALKLATAPLLVGAAIELQRLIARDGSPLRVLRVPGLAFQRLTTSEPQADQLEIALHALRRALGDQADPA